MENDRQLWQAFKQGDRHAYEQIYRLHVRVLYEYAYRFVVDKQFISDCLQDVFVDIWEKREKLAETDHIQFYLIKALRNRILRSLEKHKKWINADGQEENLPFQLIASVETLLIEEQQSQELQQRLQQAIQQLSERQKEAIYLRFYQNMSYEDIAAILEVEQQSAYNLIFRALEVLRKKMNLSILAILILLHFRF
ncbi:MAG: sigma-70 family RNA polymerase sigma factor [Thermoflexibacter sp.]